MQQIYILAKNTFTEIIRDRVLYFLLLFALLLMGLCFAIGQLSYDEIFRLSTGLGLASIHICFCGLTIFIGSSLFFREIEHKTIYTLLVRPIHRWQYLVGKYFGVLAVLLVLLLGFLFCFAVVQWLLGLPLEKTTLLPFLGIYLESCILLAATFFFSSFASPYVAVGCSLAFFLIGHWVESLEKLVAKSQTIAFYLAGKSIIYTFPSLTRLNWRDHAIAKADVSAVDLWYGLSLTLAWSLLFFALANMIFRRRDFE